MTAYDPRHAAAKPHAETAPATLIIPDSQVTDTEPVSPAVAAFRYFRRVIAAMRRKPAVPAVAAAGAAPAAEYDERRQYDERHCAVPSAHGMTDPYYCTLPAHHYPLPDAEPVLGDAMLSQVREQWNAWHDDDRPSFTPAVPTFTPSAAMDTGEFEVLDAKVDAVLRPVNGRSLGTQPRQQSVYGERCQLDVERDMALAAGERARQGYVPASPRLLDQVLAGLRKL